MALRDDLSRILEKHTVGEITKELSVICSQRAQVAMERGDDIYSEQLDACANALWEIDFGV